MTYQQSTRFRTIVDFDREYLWNRSSGKRRYQLRFFFYVRWKQFGELYSTNEKWLWLL